MLFNIETLYHALSTHFEPLYTIMYHIDPSDGAVSGTTARNLQDNPCT